MTKTVSFGKVEVGLTTGPSSGPAAARPEEPFRILVLGNFRGQADADNQKPTADFASRRPVRVDRDNLDEVIAKVGPKLRLPVTGSDAEPATLRIAALDDFHPDRIYQQVELFQQLRSLRRRLQESSTFDAAAAEVRSWRAKPAAPERRRDTPSEAPPPGGTGLTLDDLLGASVEETQRRELGAELGRDQVDWNTFVKELVAPHVRSVPAADPKQPELVACVDDAAGSLLRAILHAPAFQALESAWRGVDFLVRRVETDRLLSIDLLDVSKADLAADLSAGEELSRTGLYKHLVERTVRAPGGQPWAVVLGCYSFGPTPEDAELLGRVARIAGQGGCPFLAAASPHVVGCESFGKHADPDDWTRSIEPDGRGAWSALRQLPEAARIGLALPRFLLRQPYGRKSDPTEALAFEELRDPPDHEHYLWGNPAFAVACALAQAFSESGWDLKPGEVSAIDGLPTHVYVDDGESQVKPCAEAILTERALQPLFDAGVMPLVSVRGQDQVRLGSFQSLARNGAKLVGRWRR
jgi:type VI secretion system protein ImpC